MTEKIKVRFLRAVKFKSTGEYLKWGDEASFDEAKAKELFEKGYVEFVGENKELTAALAELEKAKAENAVLSATNAEAVREIANVTSHLAAVQAGNDKQLAEVTELKDKEIAKLKAELEKAKAKNKAAE